MAQTFQNTATVRDQNNQIISNPIVVWGSTNGSVATVSMTGLITAVAPGVAVIVASSGAVQEACLVTVTSV